MKKRVTLILSLILAMTVFCSCALNLNEKDGNLVDSKNGITYLSAPICFEPSRTETEVYAKCKSLKLELYPVTGQPTSDWLSELYEGIGGLWYADTITLPTLETFGADKVYICIEEVITTALGQITEKADIDALIDAFVSGEARDIPTSGKSYKLKFESEEYPGIYYNLLYILTSHEESELDENGNPIIEIIDGEKVELTKYVYGHYIYDRSTRRCVDIGEILEKYIPYSTDTSGSGVSITSPAAAS